MNTAWLDEIKGRLAKTTGTQWFYEEDEYSWDLYADTGYPMALKILKAPKKSKEYAEYYPEQGDGEFIANAKTDIHKLIEEYEKLLNKNKCHELKTWTKYYEAITHPDIRFRKTVELRKNDRNYQVGDYLLLRDYDNEKGEYTGRETWRMVTHIVDEQPFVPDGYVAMSIVECVPMK